MTADRVPLEARLRDAFADVPSDLAAAALDARMSVIVRAVPRPMARRTTAWSIGPRRVALAGGAGLAVVVAGALLLPDRHAVPAPMATQQALVPATSGPTASAVSPAPSGSPAPTIRDVVVITPPPDPSRATPQPTLPLMDATIIVDRLQAADAFGVGGWWWSDGRRLGRFGRTGERADGAVALGVWPPQGAELLVEARPDGIVRIRSQAEVNGDRDPLGCAPGSFGRYQIAATEDRMDLVPLADDCAGRLEAVAGTWQSVLHAAGPTLLVSFDLAPQVDSIRVDLARAGAETFRRGGPSWFGLLADGRDVQPSRATPTRMLRLDRPDARVRVGFPLAALADGCTLGADPADDVPLETLDAALTDLERRPGLRVLGVEDMGIGIQRLVRVTVQPDPSADGCPGPIAFAAGPEEDDPIWRLPVSTAPDGSVAVYLAGVPGRDGRPTVAAILVDPEVDAPVDPDRVAREVFDAIDWQPGLHPPDWPDL